MSRPRHGIRATRYWNWTMYVVCDDHMCLLLVCVVYGVLIFLSCNSTGIFDWIQCRKQFLVQGLLGQHSQIGHCHTRIDGHSRASRRFLEAMHLSCQHCWCGHCRQQFVQSKHQQGTARHSGPRRIEKATGKRNYRKEKETAQRTRAIGNGTKDAQKEQTGTNGKLAQDTKSKPHKPSIVTSRGRHKGIARCRLGTNHRSSIGRSNEQKGIQYSQYIETIASSIDLDPCVAKWHHGNANASEECIGRRG